MHPQILYMMFPDLEARFNVMWEEKKDQIRGGCLCSASRNQQMSGIAWMETRAGREQLLGEDALCSSC